MKTKRAASHAEIEKLLSLVQENPCIFDPTNIDHKDGEMLTYIWTSITGIMAREDMDGKFGKDFRFAYFSYLHLYFLINIFSSPF